MSSVHVEQFHQLLDELEAGAEPEVLAPWLAQPEETILSDELIAECERVYQAIIAEITAEWGPPDYASAAIINPGDWNEGRPDDWPEWCDGGHLTYWKHGDALTALYCVCDDDFGCAVFATARWVDE